MNTKLRTYVNRITSFLQFLCLVIELAQASTLQLLLLSSFPHFQQQQQFAAAVSMRVGVCACVATTLKAVLHAVARSHRVFLRFSRSLCSRFCSYCAISTTVRVCTVCTCALCCL